MVRKVFDAREISASLNDVIVEDVQRLAITFLRDVVLGTPVGNPSLWLDPPPPGYVGGHARRNWQVNQRTASGFELEGEDASGAAAIAEGVADVEAWGDLSVRLFVENNVPYINRLNNGWSTQAPVGFVENALISAAQSIAGRRRVP